MLCEKRSKTVDVGVTKSRDVLMRANRTGTENLLAFAARIHKAGSLGWFVQISTAYVAGRETGVVLEDGNPTDRFCGYYEQSKAAAEALVRQSGLPFSICRPGMVIGASKDGHIRSFNTIYYVMKLLLYYFLIETLQYFRSALPQTRLPSLLGDSPAASSALFCTKHPRNFLRHFNQGFV